MLNWLKHLVAGRELAELERWRVECGQAQRWFSEFSEVSTALHHVECCALGVDKPRNIDFVRAVIRAERLEAIANEALKMARDDLSGLRERRYGAEPGPVGDALYVPHTMTPDNLERFTQALSDHTHRVAPQSLKTEALADLEMAHEWPPVRRGTLPGADLAVHGVTLVPIDRADLADPDPDRVAYRFLDHAGGSE